MNDKKRMTYLLVGLVVLIVANLYIYLSDDALDGASLFSSDLNLVASPRLERVISDLKEVRRLSFREGRAQAPSEERVSRNPFIFGIDREAEAERNRKMRDLEQARTEMERAIAQEAALPVVEETRFEGRIVGVMKDSVDESLMVSVSWRQEIYILQPGDMVGGFILVDVTGGHVLFKDQNSGEEVKIDLEKD